MLFYPSFESKYSPKIRYIFYLKKKPHMYSFTIPIQYCIIYKKTSILILTKNCGEIHLSFLNISFLLNKIYLTEKSLPNVHMCRNKKLFYVIVLNATVSHNLIYILGIKYSVEHKRNTWRNKRSIFWKNDNTLNIVIQMTIPLIEYRWHLLQTQLWTIRMS